MFDIFLTEDVRKLMKNKSIVFLGDSNVRALYKDFLCLLRSSQFILDRTLKTKMENSVFGDKLVFHGEKTNARCYREEREASIDSTHVSFFFLTKVYDDYVKEVLKKITLKSNPDVIIVNSCLWDITRWGCDGVENFKENLNSLMKEFKMLFPDCLIIWVTTPPIACELKGGFLVKELQFLKYSLRFHVVEANHYARKMVVENGFDVLDTHYHLHMQIHRRCNDGIHWLPKAVRYITNLVLRHISLSWEVALPHRYESVSVDENLLVSGATTSPEVVEAKEADMIQICSGKLASSESKENVMKAIKEQDKTKKKNSVPLLKLPRKKESIHSHMAKNNKKARRKRIRQWKPHVMDHPIAASSSTVPMVWDHLMFNPNDQPYSTPGHLVYQDFPLLEHPQAASSSRIPRVWDHSEFNSNVQPYSSTGHLAHQDFPPNNSHVSYPSGDFNFRINRRSNFRGQSRFQNLGAPYVFPSVVPGQPLHLNFNFTNDEIPPNFNF